MATLPDGSILPLPSQDPANYEMVYCCRRCRGPLFRPSQLSEHEVSRHHFSYRRTAKDMAAHGGDADRAGQSGHVGGGGGAGGYGEDGEGGAEGGADGRGGGGGGGGGASGALSSRTCTSFFLQEALQWMKDASLDAVEGKLTCPHPRCKARLGTLSWAGSQCSCGTWVTPAIQLSRSACDERYFPRAQGGAGSGAAGAVAAATGGAVAGAGAGGGGPSDDR